MRNALTILALTVFLLSNISNGHSQEIRIVSWNIADFHHQKDVEARPGIGTSRSQDDLDVIKKYAQKVGGDLIALQEIATEEAAAMLYPEDRFQLFMSSRYVEDVTAGRQNDIYTAIAIKKRDDIKILKQHDIVNLQIDPTSNDPKDKPTRRGTAVKLEINGEILWFVSVHLKSSCSSTKNIAKSSKEDCKILWQQKEPLKEWIHERIQNNEHFIIAGDFNRRFRAFNDEGMLWSYLNDENLGNPLMVKHPETVMRLCPTRKGQSTEPIDWILLDAKLADSFVSGSFWERRWSKEDTSEHGRRISDHCPIRIDLDL